MNRESPFALAVTVFEQQTTAFANVYNYYEKKTTYHFK